MTNPTPDPVNPWARAPRPQENVSDRVWFVSCKGKLDADGFCERMEFRVSMLSFPN